MENFPWLTVLVLLPLLGAFVVGMLPRGSAHLARPVALGLSLVELAIAAVMVTQFDTGRAGSIQLAEVHPWIESFGISWALGVDGMALALILMSVVLVPICLVAAWRDVEPEGGLRTYFALMLALEAFIVGVFAATDVFLFYIIFEGMLIPVYFLIGLFGGPNRRRAAMKFLLYSLLGGLVMLVAVVALYANGPGGEQAYLLSSLVGYSFGTDAARWMFLAFFFAFAIKAPMVPLHTWLPDAVAEARPATSVLLVGVLDKVGTFGMIRFCLQLFPEASRWATPVVLVLAVVSVLYGALVAIGQRDMMRLIAFTSISHFGFMVLGIFAMTTVSQTGAILYMVNHGITTAALFLVAGMLIRRGKSQWVADYGGWQRVTPVLAGVFLISGLSALSLPGLNSFVSEFMVILGSFQRHPVHTVVATLGVIAAALYILRWYQRTMTGPRPDITVPDLTTRERLVMAPLIALFLLLGFFPKPVLDMVEPTATTTLAVMGVSDPAPVQASAQETATP